MLDEALTATFARQPSGAYLLALRADSTPTRERLPRSLSHRQLKASRKQGPHATGIQGCLSREPLILSSVNPMSEHVGNATVLLTAVERGDPKAAAELLELVYQ